MEGAVGRCLPIAFGVLTLVGCTRPNPTYCDSTTDCANGLVCDLTTHGCVEAADASVADGANVGRCDPTSAFGAPTLIPALSSSLDDLDLSLSGNELTSIVYREDPSALLLASRGSSTSQFSFVAEPSAISGISSVNGYERFANLSADVLSIYFERTVTTPTASYGVFMGSRGQVSDAFGADREVSVDGGALKGTEPQISQDGQTLYWYDYVDRKLYAATRSTYPYTFSQRRAAATMEASPYFTVSADELVLYYSFTPTNDVFRSSRLSKSVPFDSGVVVPNVNTSSDDGPVAITADDCVLYISSNRAGGLGGLDLWVSARGR